MIALCCILVPASAFAFSKSQEKQYTASASLLFRDAGFDQKLFGAETFQRSPDADREAATNVRLVSLDTVAQRTARRLPGIGSVKDKIEVTPEGQSDVVSVAATDHSPRRAALIANTFGKQYIAFRREADRAKIAEARALAQRRIRGLSPADQGVQARSLRGQLERLDILASLQTGNAELAEAAEVPDTPSSPKVVRNTVIGVFLGLLLGVGLALLFERLDRRLRDPKELETLFERPVLAVIGESRALSRSRSSVEPVESGEREAFRMLRANLRYFNVDHDIGSVLVTSAAPGDGKTTVAWNLASTAAENGSRVLLIEADLRHPGIAQGLGMRGARGLSTVLSGDATVRAVVQEVPLPERSNNRGVRTVEVLLSGPLPPNPSDLLESDRMRELMSEAEKGYDLVVVDTPPMSVVSDAIPLIKEIGGVIVVGRLGKTTRDAAARLKEQLENLQAPLLGIVVNGLKADAGGYGYGYGYGTTYGEQFEERISPETGGVRS